MDSSFNENRNDEQQLISILGNHDLAVCWLITFWRNLWIHSLTSWIAGARESLDRLRDQEAASEEVNRLVELHGGKDSLLNSVATPLMHPVDTDPDKPSHHQSQGIPPNINDFAFEQALKATSSTLPRETAEELRVFLISKLRQLGLTKSDHDVEQLLQLGKLIPTFMGQEGNSAYIKNQMSRQIRAKYNVLPNAGTATAFQKFSDQLTELQSSGTEKKSADQFSRLKSVSKILQLFASDVIVPDAPHRKTFFAYFEACVIANYFTFRFGKTASGTRAIKLVFQTRRFDAEYLLSRLFGFSVDITGFDELFMGGGLLLADASPTPVRQRECLPGRVALVRGGYGSGKTLLALSFAAEVAKQGGVAWYAALEFSKEVALYALARLGYDTSGKQFAIASDLTDARAKLRNTQAARGLFILLTESPAETSPVRYSNILRTYEVAARLTAKHMPRHNMFVVDPVNALLGPRNSRTEKRGQSENEPVAAEEAAEHAMDRISNAEIRRLTLASLQTIGSLGCNMMILSEDDAADWVGFGEDIADTVIRLEARNTEERADGYVARGISVTKSRLQREHRGTHPFRIRAGTGIDISLSTAARATMQASRDRERRVYPGAFGHRDLDGVLSKSRSTQFVSFSDTKQLDCGSIVLVKGPLGTFKTQLGLIFASWFADTDLERLLYNFANHGDLTPLRNRALAISMRYGDSTIQRKLDDRDVMRSLEVTRNNCIDVMGSCLLDPTTKAGSAFEIYFGKLDARGVKSEGPKAYLDSRRNDFHEAMSKRVVTCTLQQGNVYPGELFRQINDAFSEAQGNGYEIDRVLLDNPGEWEDACPLLRADRLFAHTLVDFLRRKNAKVVVTNRDISPKDSGVIRALYESVDTWISLNHVHRHGELRTALAVERTPGMDHERSTYEFLTSADDGLIVKKTAMSRTSGDGVTTPVPIRFLGRSETPQLTAYWDRICDVCRAYLSPDVEYDSDGRLSLHAALRFDIETAVDALQIAELEEHELPFARDCLAPLQDHLLIEEQNVEAVHGVAVPFYDNCSGLCFNSLQLKRLRDESSDEVADTISKLLVSEATWSDIALLCDAFSQKHSNDSALQAPVFDMPPAEENVNTLFLEILACECNSNRRDFCRSGSDSLALSKILEWKEARSAAELFCRIAGDGIRSWGQRWRVHSSNECDSSRNYVRAYGSIEAVLWRQWYSTFRGLSDLLGNEGKGTHLQTTRMPHGLASSGEWFLGILEQSVELHAARRLLGFLSSVHQQRQREQMGVGCRPYEKVSQLNRGNFVHKTDHWYLEAPRDRVRRSKLIRYIDASPILTGFLAQLVSETAEATASEEFSKVYEQHVGLAVERLIEVEEGVVV